MRRLDGSAVSAPLSLCVTPSDKTSIGTSTGSEEGGGILWPL